MEVLRLYDPDRRPPNWIDIVRPDQFVAFARLGDSGATCDAEGRPCDNADQATCLVFDSLQEARGYCSDRVMQAPSLRFDIFSSAGRAQPPLLVIVHPTREQSLEASARGSRMRNVLASGLILVSLPLMALDYWWPQATFGLAAFLGISLLVGGVRLLFTNIASRETERRRQEQLARYTGGKPL